MSDIIMRARGIRKSYNVGTENELEILHGIDLDVHKGEFVSIVGSSGSGKSTFMNILGLLDRPTSGSYTLNSIDVSESCDDELSHIRNREIGFVFQTYNLIPRTSAIKNVELPMLYAGVPEKERRERSEMLLELVGMKERMKHTPDELSGGQKRRVAIAGILACDPKIIVLDEPTAGLDPKGSKEIIDLFVSLSRSEGKTLIIVSHDNEMVYNYTDDTVVLSHGKIVYHGPTDELFADKEKLKEFNMLEPQIVTFRNELIEKGFVLSREARTLEQIASEIAKQVKR